LPEGSAREYKLWTFFVIAATQTIDLHYIKSSPITTHDGKMDSFTAQPVELRSGQTMTLTMTVKNLGDFSETVQVILKADNTQIASFTRSIAVGGTDVIVFDWDTTGFGPGVVRLNATALLTVESIGNMPDGTRSIWVLIRPKGDVNNDCTVNITDMALVGVAFGKRVGDIGFNPEADLNNDGAINIVDLAIVGSSFGQFS